MLVTAENTTEQVKAAIAARATHYVLKPFSIAVFQEKLGIVYKIASSKKGWTQGGILERDLIS